MCRIVVGLLTLLALAPALQADDPPQEKPKDAAQAEKQAATPAEQVEALAQEFTKARQDFFKEYNEAKTQEEKNKLIPKYPQPAKYAERMFALATKYPQDPAVVKALTWIVMNDRFGRDVDKAYTQLVQHAADKQDDTLLQVAGSSVSPGAEKFLRAVIAKNSDANLKTNAAFALAQNLLTRAQMTGRADPNEEQKLTGEAEKIFEEALAKDSNSKQLAAMAQQLAYSRTPAAIKLLRLILEKSKQRDAQGNACLALAENLKQQSEQNGDGSKQKELSKEAEKYYERVVKEYADVSHYNSTLGEAAKGALNELRHLGIGMVAPDIAGEDIDGKKFKLSDYRGKVVMLDFWGNW
jgi:hypothetical protein